MQQPIGGDDGAVPAPGTLKSHYAPAATVLLVDAGALDATARELLDAGHSVAVLALDATSTDYWNRVGRVTVLDSPRDVDEYARVLYSRLRDVDRAGNRRACSQSRRPSTASASRWPTACGAPPGRGNV